MKNTLFAAIAITVLAACDPEPPSKASLPSPLLTANSARLWLLLRASRVGDGRQCEEHYLIPDDPRYQGLQQKCDFWTRGFADYLRINGYPTIEYQHLQERAYWEWFLAKRAKVQACRNALSVLPVASTAEARIEHYRRRNQCDPHDDAINNKKLAPSELGVNYP